MRAAATGEPSAFAHVVLDDAKRARCLSAWNSGEATVVEIATAFRVGPQTLAAWIREWLASGETTRKPMRGVS